MPARPLRMPRRRQLLALPAAALIGWPARAQEPAATVRIATNVERSYLPPTEALLRKAYAALGLQVEFLPWPLARAQVELRAGRIDGVALRAESYFEQSPFARKVDMPLLTLQVYAFARPPCPAGLSTQELAQHRVSMQRGMLAVEALVPKAARVSVNTPADAFVSLGSGAADYALMLMAPWMAEMPLDTRQGTLCRVARPLASTALFHGVHESHAAWVAPLEQALRELRDSGEMQQAWADYERQVGAQHPRLQALPGRSLTLTPATPASAPAQPPR